MLHMLFLNGGVCICYVNYIFGKIAEAKWAQVSWKNMPFWCVGIYFTASAHDIVIM